MSAEALPNSHAEYVAEAQTVLPSWITINDQYQYHQLIDRGGYATVHKLSDKRTSEIFARKVLSTEGATIQNEIRVIETLRSQGSHRNIVEVLRHGELVYSSLYYIDMEFCDLTLWTYIYRKWTPQIEREMPYFTINLPPSMMLSQLRGIMYDIANGLSFIHEHGQVHRDIKPANVLYSHRSFTWKIGDFGLTVEGSSGPRTTVNSMGTNCYRAPELLRGLKQEFSNRVDIWALGCTFYELLFREHAFESDYSTLMYSAGERALYIPQKPVANISELLSRHEIKTLLEALLHTNPKKRPSTRIVRDCFRMNTTLFQLEEIASTKVFQERSVSNDLTRENSPVVVYDISQETNSKAKRSKRRLRFDIWSWIPGPLVLLFSLVTFAVAVQLLRSADYTLYPWLPRIASDSSLEKVTESVVTLPSALESPLTPVRATLPPPDTISLQPVDTPGEIVQVDTKPSVIWSSNTNPRTTFVVAIRPRLWNSISRLALKGLLHAAVLSVTSLGYILICGVVGTYYEGWFLLPPATVAIIVGVIANTKNLPSSSMVAHFGGSLLFEIGYLLLLRLLLNSRKPIVLEFCCIFVLPALPLYSELLIL